MSGKIHKRGKVWSPYRKTHLIRPLCRVDSRTYTFEASNLWAEVTCEVCLRYRSTNRDKEAGAKVTYRVPIKFTWEGNAQIEAHSPDEAWEIAKALNPNEIGWEGKTEAKLNGDVDEWGTI